VGDQTVFKDIAEHFGDGQHSASLEFVDWQWLAVVEILPKVWAIDERAQYVAEGGCAGVEDGGAGCRVGDLGLFGGRMRLPGEEADGDDQSDETGYGGQRSEHASS
jgi:hypothetical protein